MKTKINDSYRQQIIDDSKLLKVLAYRNMVHVQTIKNWCIKNSPMLTTHDNMKAITEYFKTPNILTHE